MRARVEVLDGFSAHADRDDLLAHVERCNAALRRVFLVHGEPPDQQEPLHAELVVRGVDARIPARGAVVSLDE